MSLKIRLSKPQARSKIFKIVVCETRSKRNGKTVDTLGFCNLETSSITLNEKKFNMWLEKGAKPTETCKKLVKK